MFAKCSILHATKKLYSYGCAFKINITIVQNMTSFKGRLFLNVLVNEFELKTLFLFLKDFEDYRDADDAVYDLNGKEYMGERYVIKHVNCILFSLGM